MQEKKGFTLIELLVVIAIIAILAAILFPVFAQARERARSATCLSNEKQASLAILQYVQDFDEQIPTGVYFDDFTNTPDTDWTVIIQAYAGIKTSLGSQPLYFRCPDDNINRIGWAGPSWRTFALAFAMTQGQQQAHNNGVATWDPGVFPGVKLAAMPAPAGTFMIVEAPYNVNVFGNVNGAMCDGPGSLTNNQPKWGISAFTNSGYTLISKQIFGGFSNGGGATVPYHNGFWNYAFADGHVKSQRPDQTLGTGVSSKPGYGIDANNNSYLCSPDAPCGPWTLRDDD